MEETEITFPMIRDNILDEDGVSTATSFTLQEWLLYKKRNLLKRKDKQEAVNRGEENKKKMLLQDALRSSNCQKIQKLKNRKHFLAWQMDFTKTKESLKTIGVSNWKTEVLKIAKESLEIDTDVKNTSLKEFEIYIKATYLSFHRRL